MASGLQDFEGILHTKIEMILSFIHPYIDTLDFQREKNGWLFFMILNTDPSKRT